MTDPRIEAALMAYSSQPIEEPIESVMAKALAAADAADWRPIESAPTDSSEVLVWNGYSVFIAVRLGEYWWSDVGCSIDNATHWQPIPAPPASIDALGGVDG